MKITRNPRILLWLEGHVLLLGSLVQITIKKFLNIHLRIRFDKIISWKLVEHIYLGVGTIVISKQRHLQNGLKHTHVQFEHSLLPHNFAHQGKDAPKYYSCTLLPLGMRGLNVFFSRNCCVINWDKK